MFMHRCNSVIQFKQLSHVPNRTSADGWWRRLGDSRPFLCSILANALVCRFENILIGQLFFMSYGGLMISIVSGGDLPTVSCPLR